MFPYEILATKKFYQRIFPTETRIETRFSIFESNTSTWRIIPGIVSS